jgi:hypothetical protein
VPHYCPTTTAPMRVAAVKDFIMSSITPMSFIVNCAVPTCTHINFQQHHVIVQQPFPGELQIEFVYYRILNVLIFGFYVLMA